MQICEAHFEKLKRKLFEVGLGAFIVSHHTPVKSVAEVGKFFTTEKMYDPLVEANFQIWANSFPLFGAGLVHPSNPFPCPLCYLDDAAKNGCGDPGCREKHEDGDRWINHAVTDQVEAAKKMGVISNVVQ